MKRTLFVLITIALALTITVGATELFLRFVKPQPTLYPRFKFSEDYGAVLYKNSTMIHKRPGHFRFVYRINEYGYRGKAIPISNRYDRANIVVLGDSYAFGTGVNDGEEFPAIMQRMLEPDYDIVNLSVGGYGLTQEIRRFYEFGCLYSPSAVVLQFCSNDPTDNIVNRVTELERNRFVFRKTNNSLSWVKIYLSHSFLQKSQLFNFLRNLIYEALHKKRVVDARIDLQNVVAESTKPADSRKEIFYNDLLETFARDLRRRGVRLIMISVNGHIQRFASIERKVKALEVEGVLEYVDVVPWFSTMTDFESPEGHSWGVKAHSLLGQKLAMIVRGER